MDAESPPDGGNTVATMAAAKPRRFEPFLAGAAASLFILVVVASSGFLFYDQASTEQLQARRRTLSNLAAAATALVDVDLHRTFHSPAQETTAAYLGAIARLERLRASNPDLKYIYTCVKRGDSVHFILDPTPAGDHDRDGLDDKSHVMQPYPDAGPSCLRALETGRAAVDDEPYSDSWGTFISAYAPVFDSLGRQECVVGVDLEIGRYMDELRGMRAAAGYGFLMALMLSILAGAGVGYAMRYRMAVDRVRQRSMEQLAAEKAKAENAARVKSDFLATMSHEIRTPLNAIMGMLDLLMDHPLGPDQRHRARTARTSAEHLLALLNDVLDFSKMDAGRVQLEHIPFDVGAVCREVIALLKGQAEEKGLHLAFRAEPGSQWAVLGDPSRFRQVLINLVGNALKFTERGGVDVDASWKSRNAAGGMLEVRVTDTGIGIPEESLELIFRKFSQADASTTRQYGGTGLGLAICKRLSEAMGGTISVKSRPGLGSTFLFTLHLSWNLSQPAADAAQEPSVPEAAVLEADLPEVPGRQAPTLPILVAEDHPVNLEVARQTLEHLGCTVVVALNGREAADKAAQGDFAAVLMDCRMPVMDGYRATEAIRALEGPRGKVPIIAITANAGEEERRRCEAAGMDDFLAKPVRRSELMEVLRRWMPLRIDGEAPGTMAATPGPSDHAQSVSHDLLERMIETFGEANPVLLAEVIKLYLDAAPETLAAIEGALKEGDLPRASRAAHALRGASAQMGAVRLAGMCAELEEAAESARETGEIFGQVRQEFESVRLELRNLAGTWEPGSAG